MFTRVVSFLRAPVFLLFCFLAPSSFSQTFPLSQLDALRYIASHPDLIEAFGPDASKGQAHYQQWGIREGRKITFEPMYYAASHADLIDAFSDNEILISTHYIQWGYKEGRKTTWNSLRSLQYIASHPDLMDAFGPDPSRGVRHFLQWGYKEKRQITFDSLRYLASHPDLIEAFGDDEIEATRHYIQRGFKEGRRATFSDVDAMLYIASHADLITAFGINIVSGIQHFVSAGFREGRQITFDALSYIASHLDLIFAFGADVFAGAKHYVQWGFSEGRRITFDVLGYLANQPDLRTAYGTDTAAAAAHYIKWGWREGRSFLRDGTSPTSRLEAHRFLVQTSFGPTEPDIVRLQQFGHDRNGYERWIDDQVTKPISLQLPAVLKPAIPQPNDGMGTQRFNKQRVESWFHNVMRGEDQLRQRVSWALSQIFVISGTNALLDKPFSSADYHDMLARNAFGNYRQLLEDVTLHPAMGVFLSMLGNRKAVTGTNIRPDENYAREMMQLFSIGLVQLEQDGSIKRDAAGRSIPTYDQETIRGFARVFTGWHWDCHSWMINSNISACTFENANFTPWPPLSESGVYQPQDFNQIKRMKFYPAEHEPGTKQLLIYPGVRLSNGLVPANQTGEQDLKAALDNVFYHPNVPPFISKQLIQKLVTSNPSGDYVRRVANVFANDGTGQRGNMLAVIKAILLDPEARGLPDSPTDGKLKEPLLRLTQLWRAYDARSSDGEISNQSFCCPVYGDNPVHIFGQSPGEAPSVFNFFSPFYAPPGEIAQAGLVAPEMQLSNENLHTQMSWFFHVQTHYRNNYWQSFERDYPNAKGVMHLFVDEEMLLADNVDSLIDRVATKLLGSPDVMSPGLRRALRRQIQAVRLDPYYAASGPGQTPKEIHFRNLRQTRVSDALYLIVTSPDFAVQQ